MKLSRSLDVEKIRDDFPVLKRQVHGKPLVYLDNAASSQKPQSMIDRIAKIYGHEYARAEEGHTLSREATKTFEGTRKRVAKLINANETGEVVFCRGATEALNLVARAFEIDGLKKGTEILLTGIEHHSNIIPWIQAARESGARVRAVPIDDRGDVDLEQLEKMLTGRVKVLGVSHVSNVTGGVQPVKQITEMAHARGVQVLVDGAQAVPHIPVDVRDIGCDFYAGSGHKMGGPSSVGFLWGKMERLKAMPAADGGSLMSETVSFDDFTPKPPPHKYEAGEPAFSEVAAWDPAIEYWQKLGLKKIADYERDLAAYAALRLGEIEGVRVLGDPVDRISIVSFVVEGQDPSKLEKKLDRQGIAVRSGNLAAEPLLRAMGVEQAVRASFVFYNTFEEADKLAEALRKIA
jgi:cysteine desulfurase/selenocysteine lyase